jgi:predicted nucleotidyltransferase
VARIPSIGLDHPLDEALREVSHVRVLRALHQLPDGLAVSGRGLARRAGVSHPRALAALALLTDMGLTTVRRLPRTDLYQLNRHHVLVPALDALFEREASFGATFVEWLRDEVARRALPISQAFVFGSAARGEATLDSDLDVAFVCPDGTAAAVEAAMVELQEDARRRFGAKLHPVVGSPSLEELTRPDRPGHALWQRIRREGVPLAASRSDPVEAR